MDASNFKGILPLTAAAMSGFMPASTDLAAYTHGSRTRQEIKRAKKAKSKRKQQKASRKRNRR